MPWQQMKLSFVNSFFYAASPNQSKRISKTLKSIPFRIWCVDLLTLAICLYYCQVVFNMVSSMCHHHNWWFAQKVYYSLKKLYLSNPFYTIFYWHLTSSLTYVILKKSLSVNTILLNRPVSHMRTRLAACRELAVDYNTLPKLLCIFWI